MLHTDGSLGRLWADPRSGGRFDVVSLSAPQLMLWQCRVMKRPGPGRGV